jgi:TolA-binding protein
MSPESTESTRGIEFLAWLELNKKPLIIGTAVVAILGSAYAIHRWRVAEQELAASSALVQASHQAVASTNAPKPDPSAFLKIASAYPSTDAAARAFLFAAEALFVDGKYAESQAQFDQFRQSYPSSRLLSLADFGVAACLEAQGKTNEAFQAYQQLVAQYPESAEASQAKLGLGGLHEAKGEAAQALRLYEDLRNTALANEAALRRDHLLVSHPELAPTNAPLPELSPGLPIGTSNIAPVELVSPPPPTP